MSKSVTKFGSQSSKQVSKTANPPPAIREVQAAAPVVESNNFIATYKDLNQPLKDLATQQKKNLIIAFVVFMILGIGIMMGQSIGRQRNIATTESMSQLIPKGANATVSQHEHFDKVCYKGENGEQVCMTRTSEKR